MTKRTKEILDRLDSAYGTEYICYLNHENAWQLLIAVILSAQCTDARVNIVTKDLFQKYDTLEKFAKADLKELEKDIHSTGFYHNKAKNVIACCQKLVSDYGGEVPEKLEDLTSLPGVGRKTANVVLSNAFNIPAIAVDTHVFRVTNRIGIVNADDVLKTEKQLMDRLPSEIWSDAHHWFIYHGRRVCKARNPLCENCELNEICCYYKKNRTGDEL